MGNIITPEIIPANEAFFHGSLCMLAAVLLRKTEKIDASDAGPLNTVLFSVFFPCLLLSSILPQEGIFKGEAVVQVFLLSIIWHTMELVLILPISLWVAESAWVREYVRKGAEGVDEDVVDGSVAGETGASVVGEIGQDPARRLDLLLLARASGTGVGEEVIVDVDSAHDSGDEDEDKCDDALLLPSTPRSGKGNDALLLPSTPRTAPQTRVSVPVRGVEGHALSTSVSDSAFRGQFLLNMLGSNIGITYPILLASESSSLVDRIFPLLVVWECSGNMPVILIVNYVIAVVFAPPTPTSEVTSPPGPGAGTVLQSTPSKSNGSSPSSKELHNLRRNSSTSCSSCCTHLVKFATSCFSRPVTVAAFFALVGNLFALQIPGFVHGIFKAFSQPVMMMFFFVIGLNLVWSRIRKRLRVIGFILMMRVLLKLFMAGVLFLGLVPLFWKGAAEAAVGDKSEVQTEDAAGMPVPTGDMRPLVETTFDSSDLAETTASAPEVLSAGTPVTGVPPETGVPPDRSAGATDSVPDLPQLSRPWTFADLRKALLFGLCCPNSGMTLGYAIEFGYDRSLQAALSTSTNILSIVGLWAVLVWG